MEYGHFTNIPFDAYRMIDAVNQSLLYYVEKSPKHAAYSLTVESKDTPAMAMGRAAHALVFEPSTFCDRYVKAIEVDKRTTQGKKDWEIFQQTVVGKTIIPADDFDSVFEIAKEVRSHPASAVLLSDIHPELTLLWNDEATGINCKGRADAYNEELRCFIDLKTTLDASESGFYRTYESRGYGRQAAWYLAGAKKIGLPVDHFCFIAAEKEPPYGVQVFKVTERDVQKYTDINNRLLQRWANCKRTQQYPSYSETIVNLGELCLIQ
jgi:hypothetical protein